MILDLKGPFHEKIIICEWVYRDGQDDDYPIYSHNGFSLHKNYEVMQDFIVQDMKNFELRCGLRKKGKFYLAGGSINELVEKLPSLYDAHMFSQKEKAKEVFVNSSILEFVCNSGLGVYLPKKSSQFRELYFFMRGQYGQVYKTKGWPSWREKHDDEEYEG